MNYLSIDKCSVADGQGFRVVLWVSGCTMNCKNCHNPESHRFSSGTQFTNDTLNSIISYLDHNYIDGITLSGGHPLEYQHLDTVYNIVKTVKSIYPDKTIWIYTGYTWEDLIDSNSFYLKEILNLTDVIVDGKYIDDKRDISLAFRGSSNQRIINVKESLKQNKIVLLDL